MQIIFLITFIFLIDSFNYATAYFGPGVALPVLLLIIGIVLAVLFLILVIFYYPLKKFFKKNKK
tara:strand:- start:275 stop:466 length:192 start_codon:yes stop_codon:yes gene_type:complete